MTQGIWHFSFTVSDLDAAVRFYTEVLGLELVHRQHQNNAYTRKLVGFDDADLLIAQLRVPGSGNRASSHDLELVQYLSPAGTTRPVRICDPGAPHLALAVADVDAEYSRMTGMGVRFFSEPNRITEGVNRGGATVYFEGPDRIVHELVQPPDRP